MVNRGNIFASAQEFMPEEIIEPLVASGTVTIERILSRGHRSADGFWYDQEQNEWVLLLKGKARLAFEGKTGILDLSAGDYLTIPAHVRHRVEWTEENEETLWLTVHY